MNQESLAQRLWQAAQTDAVLLATLRATYQGRLDVLDALWWRFRPLTPTESGHADPATERADLQVHVFSRAGLDEALVDRFDPATGTTVTATAHTHRLRALTAQLQQDAVALDGLLAVMRDWTAPTAPSPAAVEPIPAPERSDPAESNARGEPTTDAAPPRPPADSASVLAHRGRPVFFALGMVVGVVLGVFGTINALGLSSAPGPGDSASAEDNGAQDVRETAAQTNNVLQIFEENADWSGGAPPKLGSEYQPDTIRSVLGPAPAETGFGVYVARRGTAEYCIIVQDADQNGSTACATHRTIAASGLSIRAPVWSPPPPAENSVLLQVYVTWNSSGAIVAGTSPRVGGGTAPYTGSTPTEDPAASSD